MSTNYAIQAVSALLNCVSFSYKMHIFIHEVLGQIWHLDETFTLELKWWNPNQMHFKCRYPYCRRASRWWKSCLNLLKECREDVRVYTFWRNSQHNFSTSQCQSHSRGKAQSQQINREQLRPCLSNFCWLVIYPSLCFCPFSNPRHCLLVHFRIICARHCFLSVDHWEGRLGVSITF